jgi:hypothetical protein
MKIQMAYETEFKTIVDEVGKAFADYPWESKAAYKSWCAQTYFYVRHTMTMITMVAARYGAADPLKFTDTLRHLGEERGHDQLLINDLDHLEDSIENFQESLDTALFYQNQYYMIQNAGPEAHLGYALLLEAMSASYGPDVYRRVTLAHGKQAATFLDVHVIADQSHAEHGFRELASLGPQTAQAVLKNVRQSAHLYKQILRHANSHAIAKAA